MVVESSKSRAMDIPYIMGRGTHGHLSEPTTSTREQPVSDGREF